jgi:hypothetical protein
MAYNRPDPQVHHWLIPRMYPWHSADSMLTKIFSFFAIFIVGFQEKLQIFSRKIANLKPLIPNTLSVVLLNMGIGLGITGF